MENFIKGLIGVAGAAASYLFGGWSALLGVLLFFVVADYVTGLIASWFEGVISSKVGFKGIAKKIFIFVIVAVAHLVDIVLGDGNLLRDAAIFFYVANEVISILENAGRIGIPIPNPLLRAVEVLKSKGKDD